MRYAHPVLSCLLGIVISLALAPADAAAYKLELTKQYNLISFGNASLQSDVHGRTAVAGDGYFDSVGFGTALGSESASRDTLIVGGSATFNNGGQLFQGNLVHGGALQQGTFNVANGAVRQSENAFDFGHAQLEMTMLSEQLAALENTGNAQRRRGGLFVSANDPNLNVVTVDSRDLGRTRYAVINAPAGSAVVLNIRGSQADFGNMGVSVVNGNDLLYNFFEASDVAYSSVNPRGTILAPLASVKFNNGEMDGTLIAGSVTGNGQFHIAPFEGDLPFTPPAGPANAGPAIPEPVSAVLAGLGLAGLGLSLTRRRQPTNR